MIENERTKLPANALDRASTACIALSIFAPLAARPQLTVVLAASLAGWLAAAVVLHLAARWLPGGLRP
jgi:hypothetical protein